ncbi:MAG: hypothetical protein PF485_13125, partial [Bacteroidales bacterium]|nr:hypothetical protein [Bacteroidales bacterium]
MKRTFLFTIFLCFFFLIANCAYSQTSISGIINSYTAVDSIYPTKDTIQVADTAGFSINDTVMIYQAKGAKPLFDITSNPNNFGSVYADSILNAGNYELILVKEIIGDTIVVFKASLNYTYNTDDLVQLIQVPSFKNASIDGELSCEAWNDTTGGVLALMVSDTLFLNAHINVTGKGFRGATPFLYDSVSFGSNCASSDSALYESQYFNENTNTSAGFKGEGNAKYDTTYSKGLGRWANGGGGGNARFAGGGGGGNDGQGGHGGEEDATICITTPNYSDVDWSGLGGRGGFGFKALLNVINDSTIFFGGGGGSGTYISGLSPPFGGNGGGIVIIIAKVIKSNGDSIIANGANVTDIASASGSGGGAGGTVVFDIDTVIGNVTVSTKGGFGGRVQVNEKSGPGGGGGGGPVLYNNSLPNDDFIWKSIGGAPGYAQDLFPAREKHGATAGDAGTGKPLFNAPLTGFLFNSITSNQAVCMNGIPEILSGTEPRGGNGIFTFQWQHYSKTTSGWDSIPGATERDYQPSALNDTVSYRRIVNSGSIDDYGNEVEIIVQDYVKTNLIFMSNDSIICIGNPADTITGTEVKLNDGGDNFYQYIWESRTDDGTWSEKTPLNDTTFLPETISDTTFVRRIVISGACKDTASLYNPIIGLPQIYNVLSADQEICKGQIPEEIVGDPSGGLGAGTYSVSWEESTDATNWSIVTDSTRNYFAPSNLIETTY